MSSDQPIRDNDGYSYVGGRMFRLGRSVRRWVMGGGWEEIDAIGIHFVVQHPDDDDLEKRYRVRIPIAVDGHDLVVGEAEVEEV